MILDERSDYPAWTRRSAEVRYVATAEELRREEEGIGIALAPGPVLIDFREGAMAIRVTFENPHEEVVIQ